jgi:hypothetical protein
VHGALLLIPVIHPLESAERTNQSTPRPELLLIAMNAFGEISSMDHGFVGTRIHIRFSFQCAGGAALTCGVSLGRLRRCRDRASPEHAATNYDLEVPQWRG